MAHGRLDQRVDPRGPDEVRRLGAGFNAMTENLEATLEAMARQKSLAEVGAFAAELAHEVRNALTAVRVNGDASALQVLFTNLLLNAGEASPAGGVVEVAARAEAGHVVVEVRDRGAGIPRDQLARVWEPLYTTKPGGTGLGLPIARQIARGHGGTLALENGPDSGLTSRVRLPLA